MFGRFSGKEKLNIQVDMHSHLLPGLDDGVKDYDEALEIFTAFAENGYRKVITTPHIYADHYPNTEEKITQALSLLKSTLQDKGLPLEVDAAAEYYMDDSLLDKLNQGKQLLSFGKWKYVLVETAFYTKPIMFDEVIFKLKSAGYTPVLAHPERYLYLENDLSWLKRIKAGGVMLQVSLPSVIGAYGPQVKQMAKTLLKAKMADFMASDIHRRSQIPILLKSLQKKVVPQTLRNNEL